MTEVTRCFCWHQNFVPAPGLHTSIKSWKNVYKIRLQRNCFEARSKWLKWQDVSVDIKMLSPVGCLPQTHGYIHLLNQEKMCIKSEVEDIFLKLATNDQSDGVFLLTSKFWPQWVVCPCIRLWKYVHKIRGQRYVLKNATSDQSDRAFFASIKNCPHGLSPLALGLYIHVWNKTKYLIK